MDQLEALLAQKPGIRTTEFWAHAIVSLIGLLVGLHVIHTGVPSELSWLVQLGAFLAAALASGLYALSRGHAKAGPSTLTQLINNLLHEFMTADLPYDELVARLEKALTAIAGDAGSLTWISSVERNLKQHNSEIGELLSQVHMHETAAATPVKKTTRTVRT